MAHISVAGSIENKLEHNTGTFSSCATYVKCGNVKFHLEFCYFSTGGLILDYAVAKYHGIAVFSPVMNGRFLSATSYQFFLLLTVIIIVTC